MTIEGDGVVASYDVRRQALQVALESPDAPGALLTAITRWRDAVQRAGLRAWPVLRADVIRGPQLERKQRRNRR